MKIASLAKTVATLAFCAQTPALAAQSPTPVTRVVAEPARVTLKAGDSVVVKLTAYDAQGNVVANARYGINAPFNAVAVTGTTLRGLKAGSYTAVALAQSDQNTPPVTVQIPVLVTWPALTKIEITPEAGRLYTGVMLAHTAKGAHADGSMRPSLTAVWRSSDPAVASVDRFGNVTANKPGNVTISAEAEGVTAQIRHSVAANPVNAIDLGISETTVRTGDVVKLVATAKRANGSRVADAKIACSYLFTTDYSTAAE
jgi:hypothetical protein